jgi:CheY-like chemotaxis protein
VRDDETLRAIPRVFMTALGWKPEAELPGTSATVSKPVRAGHLKARIARIVGRKVAAGVEPVQVSAAPARHLRLLVAEDNPVNQKVAVRILEKAGHRVDVAANGQEAVELVRRLPYDVILMDCQMPVMDGFEATRNIRSLMGQASRTPIVALTANAMDGAAAECLRAGMDAYLTKPLRPAELIAAIDAWGFSEANRAPVPTPPPMVRPGTGAPGGARS